MVVNKRKAAVVLLDLASIHGAINRIFSIFYCISKGRKSCNTTAAVVGGFVIRQNCIIKLFFSPENKLERF